MRKKKSAKEISENKIRVDGWQNLLTGLNTARDKTYSTTPFLDAVLAPTALEAIFHGDDIANRIVSALPDECFREGWTIVNSDADVEDIQDQISDLDQWCRELGLQEKMREAMVWGRLYGVGAVLFGIDDGREPWEEVDVENVRDITYATVLDKRDLTPWRWYADPTAAKFGEVAIYMMQPVGVYTGAPYDANKTEQTLLVHESRMVRFGGELTSKRLRLANSGCDYSVLQRCFRALQLTNDNWQSAASLLADASQAVISIKGLIDMIAQQPGVVNARFQAMDICRSSMRAILLDADGEKFERVASRLEGIPQLLEQTWQRLASAARMPLTILMGQSPAGLNATGESDIRWWYDQCAATQEKSVKPQIERVLALMALARGLTDTENWSVSFAPLWQMSRQEEAALHFQQAQADNLYIQNGTLSPEEVSLSRFGGGKYDLDTQIDTESRKKILELSLETAQESAANELESAKDPAPTPGAASAAVLETNATPGVVTDSKKSKVKKWRHRR